MVNTGCAPYRMVNTGCAPYRMVNTGCAPYRMVNTGCAPYRMVNTGCAPYRMVNTGCAPYRMVNTGCAPYRMVNTPYSYSTTMHRGVHLWGLVGREKGMGPDNSRGIGCTLGAVVHLLAVREKVPILFLLVSLGSLEEVVIEVIRDLDSADVHLCLSGNDVGLR